MRIVRSIVSSCLSLTIILPSSAASQDFGQPGFFFEVTDDGEPVEDVSPALANLPGHLRTAVFATIDGESGEIAGAAIAGTDLYAVYTRGPGWCGSGGCRAQIWRDTGNDAERLESLPVGWLPIVRLADGEDGRPRLGVTIWEATAKPYLLGVEITTDGWDYGGWREILPVDAGEILLSAEMLAPYEPSLGNAARFPEKLQGMWAQTLAECEPEMTGAMLIGSTRIEYYEGWDELIAIERNEVFTHGGKGVTARLSYNHADGPQPARTVDFAIGPRDLKIHDGHGRQRYLRCPSNLRR